MIDTDDARLGIGGNLPDVGAEITNRLLIDYAELERSVEEFQRDAASLPPSVETKEDHDEYVNLVSQMRAKYKAGDAARVAEKAPFLASERAVEGYFKERILSPLERTANRLTLSVKVFLDRKAEETRAEQRRIEDENRREAARLREEADKRQRAADEATRRDRAAKNAAAAAAANAEAERADERADEAAVASQAKPADLARTRSTEGSLSTLKAEWIGTIEDINAIPLDNLRAYIKPDVIQKAVDAAVRFGVRDIPGVRIYQGTKVQIR